MRHFLLGTEPAKLQEVSQPENAVAPPGHEMKAVRATRKALAFLRKSAKTVKIYEPTRHAVYARDGHSCAYCHTKDPTGQGVGLTIDHILARNLDGAGSDAKNMLTCCLSCNSAKQDKTTRQWTAYAKASGVTIDWKALRNQAKRVIDMEAGKRAAEAAKAFRAQYGGARGVALSRAVAEGLKNMATTSGNPRPKTGPGVHRDDHGKFSSE